jgi:hypothetical protein
MNGRPLTDVRISQALRAHLPQSAPAGLGERILNAAETTRQQRVLPTYLGALTDADPVSRRRSLLIAAALLLALAIASAAAVGALRLLQRDPVDELSLEPPADVPAFVLSSYERLQQLPPVALAWQSNGLAKGRVYVDRSGAVRFDRFTSAEASEPSSYTILNANHRISGMAPVDSEAVWIEEGHEAIGDDPRVFLRGIFSVGPAPGCEMARDQGDAGNANVATGWRYVGVEHVVGRPTHRVACVGELGLDIDLWIDIETRLILRSREPLADDAGQAVPGQFETTEVTEIAFGDQRAALFERPEGVTRMSADAYGAYLCTAGELPNEQVVGLGTREGCPTEAEATPPPEPSPTPMPTVRPNTSPCAVRPGDPSERIGPLAWTQASLKEDWPAPVRPEPAGGRSVLPMPLTHLDPSGDTGSDAFPCIDIQGVMVDSGEVHLKLDSGQPVADPAEQWIAYGIVTDDDRDGVPDWRYGIDNIPADAARKDPPTRGWRTNLHTGQTDAGPEHGDPVWWNGGGFKGGYPRYPRGSDAGFRFGGSVETTQGSQGWGFELDMPFYAWASVIVNGRVVATDYAPDTGWLVATRGARPGGTFLLGDPFPNLSMTVPEGWTMNSDTIFVEVASELRRVTCGDLPRDYPRDTSYQADCAHVGFDVIDDPEELCDDTIEPPLGSSFEDLVTYVAGLPTVVSENVTVDGYRGIHISRPEDVGNCVLWSSEDVWILDVDGVRLMIGSVPHGDLLHGAVPEEAVKAQIRQMVESIHFEH